MNLGFGVIKVKIQACHFLHCVTLGTLTSSSFGFFTYVTALPRNLLLRVKGCGKEIREQEYKLCLHVWHTDVLNKCRLLLKTAVGFSFFCKMRLVHRIYRTPDSRFEDYRWKILLYRRMGLFSLLPIRETVTPRLWDFSVSCVAGKKSHRPPFVG